MKFFNFITLGVFGNSMEILFVEKSHGKVKLVDYDFEDSIDRRQPDAVHEAVQAFLNKQSLQKIPVILDYSLSDSVLVKSVYQAIQALLKKQSLRKIPVIFNCSQSDSVLVKSVDLPPLPDEEIPQAVVWPFKDEAVFPLNEACVDWQDVRQFTDEQGTLKKELIVAVAEKDVVQGYIELAERCRLEPAGLFCRPFNYAFILRNLSQAERSTAVILDIHLTGATLSIYDRNRLRFARKMPVSWNQFLDSLTEIIIGDSGKVELTRPESEMIAKTIGIPQSDAQTIREGIKGSHITALIRPLLEALVREIRFSMNYMTNMLELPAVDKLYLTGSGANLKNLPQYLGRELNLQALYLPLPANIDASFLGKAGKDFSVEDRNRLMYLLGAAMDDEAEMNLLPPEVKNRRIELIQKGILRLAGVTLLAVFLIVQSIGLWRIGDYRKRIRTADVHLENLARIRALTDGIRQKRQFIDGIQAGYVPLAGLMKLVSRLIPAAIILDHMKVDEEKRFVEMKGHIDMTDKQDAESILIQFIETMEDSMFFSDVFLISSNTDEVKHVFEIKGELVSKFISDSP